MLTNCLGNKHVSHCTWLVYWLASSRQILMILPVNQALYLPGFAKLVSVSLASFASRKPVFWAKWSYLPPSRMRSKPRSNTVQSRTHYHLNPWLPQSYCHHQTLLSASPLPSSTSHHHHPKDCVKLHCVKLHCVKLHCVKLHCIRQNRSPLPCTSLLYSSLNFWASDSFMLRENTLGVLPRAGYQTKGLSLTLSLLRVINVKIPLQPHKKYDITQ